MDVSKYIELQRGALGRYAKASEAIRLVWDLENPGVVPPDFNGAATVEDEPRVRRSSNKTGEGEPKRTSTRLTRPLLRKTIEEASRKKRRFTARDIRAMVEAAGVSTKDSMAVYAHVSQLAIGGELRVVRKDPTGRAGQTISLYEVVKRKFKAE